MGRAKGPILDCRDCAGRVRIEMFSPAKYFSAAKSQIFHVCDKNAKLNTPEKIAEMLGELEGCVWDIVCFSEARSSWGVANLPHEHKLFTSLQNTNALGDAFFYLHFWSIRNMHNQ